MVFVVVGHSFNNQMGDVIGMELVISIYSPCAITCEQLNHSIFLHSFYTEKLIGKNTKHVGTKKKEKQKMYLIVTGLKLYLAVLMKW